MPRVVWQLQHGRPAVEVTLTGPTGGHQVLRTLLADTGAGAMTSRFEILLRDTDCLQLRGIPLHTVVLGRAYKGRHRVYLIRAQIPALGFDRRVRAVAVASPPTGFDGNACLRFLNFFTYGNFGNRHEFGLEL
jgi:hypothetical protein